MKNLNELYTAFISSPTESSMNDLLAAVRRRAAAVLKDEDRAQAFILKLWEDLAGEQEQLDNFSGWINVRLRWANVDKFRATRRAADVQTLVAEGGDDEEVLSILSLESTGDEDPFEHDPETLLGQISDPFVHKVADRLLDGASLTQISAEVGMTRNALYQRLWRYRQAHGEQLKAAA